MTSRYLLRKLPSSAELANTEPAWASYWKALTLPQPRFNIGAHPHKTSTVITHTGAQEMLFGMKPHWAKTLLLNAKAESLKHSEFWKPLAAMRPCLIPADGFYVINDLNSEQKTWYGVEFSDHHEFFLVGLWKSLNEDVRDTTNLRFVLLTQESHSCVKHLSARMPVIFNQQHLSAVQAWMNTKLSLDERIGVLLQPMLLPELISFAVGLGVKNLGRDDDTLFKPV